MDEQELEDGELNSRQGYLIRLNMISTHLESEALRARLLQKILAAHQHLRLESDTRSWVLHGFATWWPLREKVATPQELIAFRQISFPGLPKILRNAKSMQPILATMLGVASDHFFTRRSLK